MDTSTQHLDTPTDEQPLAPLPGLQLLGAAEAEACADGACALPADDA